MSTHDTAAPIPRGDDAEILAEVIELRGADTTTVKDRLLGFLNR